MNLESFIHESIVQIVNGVHSASTSMDDKLDARVNPYYQESSSLNDGTLILKPYNAEDLNKYIRLIDFDIAVTATKESNTKGGIKVAILPINLDASGNSSAISSTVSRIKFQVPVQLPIKTINLDEKNAHIRQTNKDEMSSSPSGKRNTM